jgi:hypothetical protein
MCPRSKKGENLLQYSQLQPYEETQLWTILVNFDLNDLVGVPDDVIIGANFLLLSSFALIFASISLEFVFAW